MYRLATTVLFAALLVATGRSPVHAQIYVDKDASGTSDGTSWTNAYTDLQTAIDNATASDEIWIAEGVYTPDGEGDSFTVTGAEDGLKIYGGFEGTESSREHREPKSHRTILSGDLNGDDTDPDGDGIIEDADDISGSNAHNVLFLDGTIAGGPITANTRVDGVLITAGQADGSHPESAGGGLFCDGSGDAAHACSPTLRRVVVAGNRALAGEGAWPIMEGTEGGEPDHHGCCLRRQ